MMFPICMLSRTVSMFPLEIWHLIALPGEILHPNQYML
ncbi:BnaCnng04100D [Brassica napus]|uniref:BnaCnng04100D protein n=1 Tax=Brassica napus TaxID=3708 RepID=A0A078FQ79_BRANA|nr:BnaCnng04100D [Brassica napus]